MKFTAQIEVINGKILINPDDCYIEFEDFCYKNRNIQLGDIVVELPF